MKNIIIIILLCGLLVDQPEQPIRGSQNSKNLEENSDSLPGHFVIDYNDIPLGVLATKNI